MHCPTRALSSLFSGSLSQPFSFHSHRYLCSRSNPIHSHPHSQPQPQLPTPTPITVLRPWEQAAVAVGSAVGAFINPARADFVAALGETTGGPAFHLILERMKASPEGQQILNERPRVIASQVQHAWDMPENTFGGAYAKFMGSRNFSPDDRPPVRFVESEELAYVAQRAREVHDFWHVLFNCPTSVVGELALKMVEFQQTLLPMCFLSVAGASWRLKSEQRAALFKHYGPWAMRAGRSARDLMCIYYEKHLHEDLDEVRSKWGYALYSEQFP
ncbi:ubiquinone biosynthesis protein COQ4 homolog, mitochondrial isoform X2 [Physcomitrium patens]|uniref:ubiquinone biosynthesis protein COQ4 homolog, mitochondrial isoform X2 n=1 Tax=Physcomitrium patens TaxID=3218 RepID=UPI000D1553D2|nr:ubiquinone biosynthesis protein COQ4 homolog, mitochondrial-like isoform X2 [Physcomitrium patens]|eukprot:XP_024399347.1 ubiquinone biosynthesis protein COQ4 homolog, mitochondrial-like isoform X2 [Physcomitrella patens]